MRMGLPLYIMGRRGFMGIISCGVEGSGQIRWLVQRVNVLELSQHAIV